MTPTTRAELTRAVLAPPPEPVDESVRAGLRDQLVADVGPAVEHLPVGASLEISLPVLRRAGDRPDLLAGPEEAFVWKPLFVRRSLGLAVVRACLEGRYRSPGDAVEPVATDAVAEWHRTGWRTFHWEPWLSGLAEGARAVVLAEAVGWATALWAALDWSALPDDVQVGGPDDQWMCPAARTVRLRGRSDLRVRLSAGTPSSRGRAPAGSPTALLTVGGGLPGDRWPEELAYLALVGSLRSPTGAVPARVVGVWPEAGRHAVVDIDGAALTAAAGRVASTVSALVDARTLSPVPS